MVDSITSTTTNATDRIGASSTTLVSNFETFLTLLTAQLKNQDPLSPVDAASVSAFDPQHSPGGDDVVDELLGDGLVRLAGCRRRRTVHLGQVAPALRGDRRRP